MTDTLFLLCYRRKGPIAKSKKCLTEGDLSFMIGWEEIFMGLTIHYHLSTDHSEVDTIRSLVKEFRQLALALPFQAVEEIVEFREEETSSNDRDDPHRWLKIQASHYLQAGNRYLSVAPLHVIAFTTIPGAGSEPANFGLARYPQTIELV